MIPIFQETVEAGKGDCLRASTASLFELELSQVPNFILFPDETWWNVYWYFIYSLGYEIEGTGYPSYAKLAGKIDCETVGGCLDACVPSRTFEGKKHAVLINLDGVVVHDPNPNQLWLGENVLMSGDLEWWTIIKKREENK